jgi:hypothetical protein
MTKVFIVEGSTGEYSDHCEWLVKAFLSENCAREFTELCAAEHRRVSALRAAVAAKYRGPCKELDYSSDEYLRLTTAWHTEETAIKHKYDANWQEDYIGTNYEVLEVELVATVADAIGGVEITDHKFEPVEGRAWKACAICGIIERNDGKKNSPCKGPAHLRPLEI